MSGFFPGLSVLVAFADMPGKYGSHSMGTASLSYYHHGKIYAQFFLAANITQRTQPQPLDPRAERHSPAVISKSRPLILIWAIFSR